MKRLGGWCRTGGKRAAVRGLLGGAAFGLAATAWFQIAPRLHLSPDAVFNGAPQGLDQYTYMAMARAIWRGPNGISYAYPFSLYWPAPPVLFQFPLMCLAWIARLTGIPAAFEIGRVAGAAASGAGLALIVRRLVSRRRWRAGLLFTLALGGGWVWIRTVGGALRIAGPAGLSEVWAYHRAAFDGLYYWAPYVAENIVYPMEAIYHGIVFGALAALVWKRDRLGLLLGLVAWFSNPFTAIALSAAVGPWWLWRCVRSSGSGRRHAARHLAAWVAIMVAGMGYYGPFLGQWPALKDLSRQYSVALLPPLSWVQMLCLWGPWIAGLAWSVSTRAGRRHVWGRPGWSLFAFLAITQMALAQQGWILGERAVQAPHYNRGYLLVGMVVVFWRAAMVWSPRANVLPRWLLVAALLTVPDQGLFFLREVLEGQVSGIVSRDLAAVVERTSDLPPSLVTYTPMYVGSYLAAFSNEIPYEVPESMVVPFPERRRERLDAALRDRTSIADLGIRLAVARDDDTIVPLLKSQGWGVYHGRGGWLLMTAPGVATEKASSR